MTTDDPLTSVPQDGWIEFAAAVRLALGKRIPELATMNAVDLGIFVETAETAYWLELKAHSFDKKLALELSRTTAD